VKPSYLVKGFPGHPLHPLGGWLGGTVVFVHGMRVLSLVDEPALRAATPGQTEKERASGARADHDEARAGLTRH
jgi:hypothetical protein